MYNINTCTEKYILKDKNQFVNGLMHMQCLFNKVLEKLALHMQNIGT